ncbi:MAG: M23 family metallopeptidase [Gaiellaceae bacterium]
MASSVDRSRRFVAGSRRRPAAASGTAFTHTAIFTRAGLYLAVLLTALTCTTAAAAKNSVPQILFPVVGAVTYTDDFGQPRAGGAHQGNDLLGKKRAPVVAVEDGTVKFWTTSASAGCMLYLYGASGTMYEYIHLNNDLTAANDNRGKCVDGVSYAPGLLDGEHVAAGQLIGYLGDSGDANGIHPHLHFEVHPKGGKAVSPFPYLQKAAQLLVPAPPAGSPFTLKLTGTIAEVTTADLTVDVDTLAAWPSHVKQTKVDRLLTLTAAEPDVVVGQKVTVWTMPAPGTIEALTGVPLALSVDRVA